MEKINKIEFENQKIYLLLGRTGQGKNYFLRDLLKSLFNKKILDYIYVFCRNQPHHDFYIIKDEYLNKFYYRSCTPEMLQNIIKLQEERQRNNLPSSCGIVLDDSFIKDEKNKNKTLSNNGIFTELLESHRHLNITLFFLVQKLTLVNTFTRTNCNYVFLIGDQLGSEQYGKIFKEFGDNTGKLSLKEFSEFINKSAYNNNIVLINNVIKVRNYKERISLLKARAVNKGYYLEFNI
jgi:hypothetical protein